ncbi:MAG: hypothetical protein GF410_01865 [Chitinivibrionales bacterium]|nr:hypothetical protein [Chitinivibrionales bacterium]
MSDPKGPEEVMRFSKETLDRLKKRREEIGTLREINKLTEQLGIPTKDIEKDLDTAEKIIDMIERRSVAEEGGESV